MGILNEPTPSPGLAPALKAGIASIAQNATVEFTRYSIIRVQQDGFVFWVAGQAQPFPGSLHYGSDVSQAEDATIAVNDVVFTSPNEISQLNAIDPSTLWVATVTTPSGTPIYIAFRAHGLYYEPANVWHYRGQAVYPTFQTQLIQSAADLPAGPIVSNSLPIWLAQDQAFPIYPSFLVPANVTPPYAVAHVNSTRPLNGFPYLVPPPKPTYTPGSPQMYTWGSDQLLADTGQLTFYGFTSQQAMQFLFSLMEQSRNTDAFGFMDSPAFYDDRAPQPELQAIAMKKTLRFEVSYYLATADAVARRYILSAALSTTVTN